jgi:hypothetical protein
MTDKKKKDLCKEKTEKVLLVEGKTDCHVVMSLCEAFNVTEGLFGIYQCESDDGVLKRLDALIAGYGDPKEHCQFIYRLVSPSLHLGIGALKKTWVGR